MTVVCSSGDKLLDSAVNHWLKLDKNPETRKEVEDDIKNVRWEKLKQTMLSRQKFGTAGLRGKMAAGFKCMNDVVVLQTAQGLCSYLKKVCNQGQLRNGFVVGYDGRYNSERFAELTAKVFISNSIPVHLFSAVCPTPLVSFATILYECAGGVMVTASHNPKEDNGYKVYWGNGTQIIYPHDTNILQEIVQNLEIPEEYWDIKNIRSNELVKDCHQDVSTKYNQYIFESLHEDILKKNESAGIKIVYSAMHGVGYKYILDAFKAAKLKAPISTKEQQDPDPEFPTVKFPNPEETECLSLSCDLAEREGARLVLVNDPDADRLAVAEFDHSAKKWKIFSGNEMGSLLGWWLLQQYRRNAKIEDGKERASLSSVHLIASVVSSKMLRSIAQKDGCQFVETLTGFKWMGNTTLILAREGKVPLFAFEEAIGYMCSPRVPDKDGVSAAVQVASLASQLYSNNSSLADQLQALYSEYGFHTSHNSYYLCHEPATIQKIFRGIRNYKGTGTYPRKVGACEIVSINDLAAGVKIPDTPNGDEHGLTAIGTGLDQEYTGGEMVMFRCSSGLSVTVRTSGTEPKVKYYTELVTNTTTQQEQEQIKKDLQIMVKEFVEELLQPKEHGLIG
ncbi:phosphopentomutase [Plutella xylostella]|uniref:phosphopentomutase n=1 Tax=Plutella xylostella TaxID=51655 RepID=UPI0020325CBB|nr:phosphopentomutase [Plutella xylostella]